MLPRRVFWSRSASATIAAVASASGAASRIGVPLLGSVPLDPALREAGDAGMPILESAPDAEATAAIVALAERIQRTRRGTIRKALTVLS